jgi:anti-sigma B factor antagonist
MRIDKTIRGRITRLCLNGELDLFEADEVRQAGCAALDAHCSTLRLDLSGVSFIGASGLAALVAIRNDALAQHVLVLENVSPVVDRVLRVSGLDTVFNIDVPCNAARTRQMRIPATVPKEG